MQARRRQLLPSSITAVGKPSPEDVLVYERADQKEWGFNGNVTEIILGY